MGRLIKNPTLGNGTSVAMEAVSLPVGVSSLRPTSPVPGSTRYNTDTDKLELWNGVEWRIIGTEGLLPITKDTFTGDGSTTTFGPMTYSKQSGDELRVFVYVGNVPQNPGVAYTFDGTSNITFTSPPPTAHSIVVLHGFDSTVAE